MYLRPASLLLILGGFGIVVPPLSAGDKPKGSKDPSEVVCEKQTVIGSRLATRRVCATRAEWAEQRRLDREAIDQGQRSACMVTGSSKTGQAAC